MTMFSPHNAATFSLMSPLQLGHIGTRSNPTINGSNSDSNSNNNSDMDERAESSSKGEKEKEDEEWLQLSIGTSSTHATNDNKREIELSSDNVSSVLVQPKPVELPRRETLNWGLVRPPIPSSVPSSSAVDFRVIPPPRRPHSGLWFMLLAEKESGLPQISKSYLRIKDGKMTIRVVIKYLANKLRLENQESQIEISCKGQRVEPSSTLQYVRDSIWSNNSQRDFVTLHPNSSTSHHIMVLHYAQTASS